MSACVPQGFNDADERLLRHYFLLIKQAAIWRPFTGGAFDVDSDYRVELVPGQGFIKVEQVTRTELMFNCCIDDHVYGCIESGLPGFWHFRVRGNCSRRKDGTNYRLSSLECRGPNSIKVLGVPSFSLAGGTNDFAERFKKLDETARASFQKICENFLVDFICELFRASPLLSSPKQFEQLYPIFASEPRAKALWDTMTSSERVTARDFLQTESRAFDLLYDSRDMPILSREAAFKSVGLPVYPSLDSGVTWTQNLLGPMDFTPPFELILLHGLVRRSLKHDQTTKHSVTPDELDFPYALLKRREAWNPVFEDELGAAAGTQLILLVFKNWDAPPISESEMNKFKVLSARHSWAYSSVWKELTENSYLRALVFAVKMCESIGNEKGGTNCAKRLYEGLRNMLHGTAYLAFFDDLMKLESPNFNKWNPFESLQKRLTELYHQYVSTNSEDLKIKCDRLARLFYV